MIRLWVLTTFLSFFFPLVMSSDCVLDLNGRNDGWSDSLISKLIANFAKEENFRFYGEIQNHEWINKFMMFKAWTIYLLWKGGAQSGNTWIGQL
jgi:hypothetical protein